MSLGTVILPTMLDHHRNEHIVTMLLHIPTDLAFFAGHFSSIAIVPGVVQLHWAVQFANDVFNLNSLFTNGSKIKFKHIMLPNDKPLLKLEHIASQRLILYSYTTQDEESYSSGSFNYRQQANNIEIDHEH